MSLEENKAIVRRFFEEGPSKGNLSVAGELLSPNFALHTPLPSAPGIQGMTDIITICRAAFEHLDVTVEVMSLPMAVPFSKPKACASMPALPPS